MANLRTAVCAMLVGSTSIAGGQSERPSTEIKTDKTATTISVDGYEPLREIIETLVHEYGWLVSYEDPFYRDDEVIDIAVPSWRLAHKGERGFYVPPRRHVLVSFRTPTGRLGEESSILTSVVQQYNSQDRLHEFSLLRANADHFTVAGSTPGQQRAADVEIDSSMKAKSASTELERVVKECSQGYRLPFVLGAAPINALNHSVVAQSNGRITCREGIQRIMMATDRSLIYELNQDIAGQQMFLSIIPARQYKEDAQGKKVVTPVL